VNVLREKNPDLYHQ